MKFIVFYSVIGLLYGLSSWGVDAPYSFPQWAASVGLTLVELLTVLLLHLWVDHIRSTPRRAFVHGVILLTVGAVYLAQTYAVHLTQAFISVVAMENADDIQWIQTPLFSWGVGLLLATTAGYGVLLRRASTLSTNNPKNSRWVVLFLFAGIAWLVLVQSHIDRHLSENKRTATLAQPMTQLIATGIKFLKQNPPFFVQWANYEIYKYRHNITKDFYFNKDSIRHTSPTQQNNSPPRYNLVVFFVEGLSARFISGYDDTHQNLTPHMDALMAESLRVDNYFNHTAATFRGIQGQLTSSYPSAYGAPAWDTPRGSMAAAHYTTLPSALRSFGYRSAFISPENSRLNNMLRAMGFDRVYTGREASVELLNTSGISTPLPDAMLLDANIEFLRKHEGAATQPFLLATYNLGTHALRDSPAGGKRYEDGKNKTLNRIHHFDHQLGGVLAFFQIISPREKHRLGHHH